MLNMSILHNLLTFPKSVPAIRGVPPPSGPLKPCPDDGVASVQCRVPFKRIKRRLYKVPGETIQPVCCSMPALLPAHVRPSPLCKTPGTGALQTGNSEGTRKGSYVHKAVGFVFGQNFCEKGFGVQSWVLV